MAEVSYFFNSAPGDPRKYQASDFAEYFNSVLQSGVIKENGDIGLRVTASNGMSVSVATGKAIIKGQLYKNTTPLTLTVGLPDATANRWDRIVLRLDLTNAVRSINAYVKRGTATAPPTLQRDETIYEISLARIYLPMNTATINMTNITDERTDRTVAGTVRFTFEVVADEVAIQDAGFHFNVKSVEGALQQLGANSQQYKMVQNTTGYALNLTTTTRPRATGLYTYRGNNTSWLPAGNGPNIIENKQFAFGGISTLYTLQTIEYLAGGRYWAYYNDDTQTWSGWTRIVDEVDIQTTHDMINSIYAEFTTRTIQNVTALTSGASVTGSGNAVYREGKRVYFELICSLPNGMAAGSVIMTLHSALRPTKLTYMPIQANNNQFIQFAINASGQVIVNTSITSSTAVSVFGSFALSPER